MIFGSAFTSAAAAPRGPPPAAGPLSAPHEYTREVEFTAETVEFDVSGVICRFTINESVSVG